MRIVFGFLPGILLVLLSLLACALAQEEGGGGGGGDIGSSATSTTPSSTSTPTSLSSTTLIDNPSTTYTATVTSLTITSASSAIPTQSYVPIDDASNENSDNDDNSDLPEMPLTIKITPAFGVLGAILIVTAIPLAVLGSTSRWTGVCIPVSYGSMIALMCILLSTVVMPKLHSNNPERASEALEGEILVGCAILGIITAVASWWFQRYVAYAVCGFAGMALAWWIQCMRDGGTIHSMAGKWIFYIGLGTVAVVASFHPKIMPHLLRFSTSLIGSSAFLLGIDCFVKSGLKEFYVYNLGYNTLYPSIKKEDNFPLTQTEVILLAVIAATTLLSLALQYRLAILAGRKAKIGRDEAALREMGLDPHDIDVDSLEIMRNKRREDALEAWENQNGGKRGAIAAAKQAVSGAFFNKASTPVNVAFETEKGAGNGNAYRHSSSMEKGSYRDSSSVSPQLGLGHTHGVPEEQEEERPVNDHLPLPPAPPAAPTSPPPLLPPLSAFGEEQVASRQADEKEERGDEEHRKSLQPPGLPPPLEQKGPLPTLDLGFGSEMRSELGLPEPNPEEIAKAEAEARSAAAATATPEPVVPPRPDMKRQRAPSAPTLLNRKSFEKAEADLKAKEALLSDIANIRKSIDELRSRSTDELRGAADAQDEGMRGGGGRGEQGARSASISGFDKHTAAHPAHTSMSDFPIRRNSKRMKSQSTQSFALRQPAQNDDLKLTEWEQYVRSRQIVAPPAGVSRPINRDSDADVEVSPAVAAAIEKRKHSSEWSNVDRNERGERYNPFLAAAERERERDTRDSRTPDTPDWESVSPKQQVFDDDAGYRSRAHSQSNSHNSRKNSIPFSYEIGRATPTLASRRPSASPSGARAYSHDNVTGSMSHTRTPTAATLSKFDASDYGAYNNRNRSRSMTVEELQARHRAHLSKLQSPINQKFEYDRRVSEYEALKGARGGMK
ncbi:hypothetical protein E3P99_02987 [Wallemia hederae]|uniref:TM7S3/TM198-like domain-containing protein n=1 Tax=Wallemia hederae TaxID=1540922 RepID=A0A4V4LSU4_9BASI|nr:hypothetical protein E3P99_02987 [Wallemia hederae]